MILVILTAMGACLAIGVFIGWLLGSDRGEEPARHAYPPGEHVTLPAPRHAQTQPLRLKHVAPTEGELAAYYAAAASHFPGLPAPAPQPPLGELVRAERVTDFIERLQADTDRWLAAHVEGAR